MSEIVAIDIGGTFTDIVTYDEGELKIEKILNEENLKEFIMKIIGKFKPKRILHATTLATNALITGDLPKTAILTTQGFRDLIEIGRQNRPKLYDLFFEKPRILVPRELRFEVNERTDHKGNIIKKIDEKEVEEKVLKALEYKIEALAVCFLHSYANPYNENLAKEIAKKRIENVCTSSEVAPEPREYERFSTALINTMLIPIVRSYLENLENIEIMSNAGGIIDKQEAISKPVQIIESGPAAGVVACALFSRILNLDKTISLDIGGTTAKTSLIINGEVSIVGEYEVAGKYHHGRVIKGSGYPIRSPFVDIAEVSAGGGSIIWKDEAGGLHVGPMSAGAKPGPACYGRGGERATLTDANLYLGRIGDELAGGLKLNFNLAEKALKEIGDPLEIADEALKLSEIEVARAIRLISFERGYDPQEFVLMSFGGAGPQHATKIADILGMKKVIIPPFPGLFSSLGLLLCDRKYESRMKPKGELEEDFRKLEGMLKNKGKNLEFLRFAEVRYKGQGWELMIEVQRPAKLEEIKEAFEKKHFETYGFSLDEDIEIVLLRVFAIERNKTRIKFKTQKGEVKAKGFKKIFDGVFEEAMIYKREELPIGFKIEGPAIIEEYSSCTYLPRGWELEVIEDGFLQLIKI